MIGPLQDRLRGLIPEIRLPKLGRRVDIPIYLIHNSVDPEDYFFIFDFEQFVERSRAGVFARPVLNVWAGRSDFDRTAFARQFRRAFARDFDAARATLNAEDGERGGRLTGMDYDAWPLPRSVAQYLDIEGPEC